MERWTARTLGTIVLAWAGSAVASPAVACVCVEETVTVVWAKGRVFMDGPSGPEALPDATVELRKNIDEAIRALSSLGLDDWASNLALNDDERLKLSVTTTDAKGMFELKTPPPGDYRIKVSLRGFPSTSFSVRIKKGRPGARGRLILVHSENLDCPCGYACVSKADRSGNVEPKCLKD